MHLRLEFDPGVGPTCFKSFCGFNAKYKKTTKFFYFKVCPIGNLPWWEGRTKTKFKA